MQQTNASDGPPKPLVVPLARQNTIGHIAPDENVLKKSRKSKAPGLKAAGDESFGLYALTYNSSYYSSTCYELFANGDDPKPSEYSFLYAYEAVSISKLGNQFYVFNTLDGAAMGAEEDYYILNTYQIEDDYIYYTGQYVLENEQQNDFAFAQAFDPTGNTLYGLAETAEGTRLFILNFTGSGYSVTYSTTTVGTLEGKWNSIACDNSGQLYGIKLTADDSGVTGSKLCKINKSDATFTEIGDTGLKPYRPDGAVFDPNTNAYLVLIEEALYAPTSLVSVNISDGTATKLATYDDSVDMFPRALFKISKPNPLTPNPATDLKVEFEGKTHTGTFTFTAPETNLDGGTEGDLTYEVKTGENVYTGSCEHGKEVSLTVTVPNEGYNTISVTIFNNGSIASDIASLNCYAGLAVPASLGTIDLALDKDANEFILTWKPGNNYYAQGYLNEEDIRYTVVRYPGAVVVADKIEGLEFREPADHLTDTFNRYYYTVQPFNETVPSAQANPSNAIAAGTIYPPFTEDFNNGEISLAGFTIEDFDGDNKMWKRNSNNVRVLVNNNSNIRSDDWFITPPVYLERGKTYYFDVEATVNFKYPSGDRSELLQLYVGTGNTHSVLRNQTKLATWNVTDYNEQLKASFSPEETGIYYLGYQYNSRNDLCTGGLTLDNLSLSYGVADTAPDAPELKVERNANGELEAYITVKAPTADMSGNTLESIEKLDVMRGDNLIHTFENPAPGAEFTFTDYPETPGTFTWKAVAYNADGAGKQTEPVEVFIGQDIAAAVENFKVVETEYGKLRASWSPADKDRNGNTIDPSRVRYNLLDGIDGRQIARLTSDTEIDFDAFTDRHQPQQWKQYILYAITDAGYDYQTYALSNVIITGTPDDEYTDTFSRGVSDYYPAITLLEEIQTGSPIWKNSGISSLGVTAFAGEGMLEMVANNVGDKAALITPRVHLAAQEHPSFSVQVFNNQDGADKNLNMLSAEVLVMGSDNWIPVAQAPICDITAPNTWGTFSVSLADYAEKIVQIRLSVTAVLYAATQLDVVSISSGLPVDIDVYSIDTPVEVAPGDKFAADVTLYNRGLETVNAFKVAVEFNGEKQILDGTDFAPNSSQKFTAEFTMPELNEACHYALTATATAENDCVEENNTLTTMVDPLVNRLPAPENLTGTLTDDGKVSLSWDAPASTHLTPETESFSDSEPFKYDTNYKDWIFVDRDDTPSGKVPFEFVLPGYKAGETKTSFFVWNGQGNALGSYFLGSDDDCYLTSIHTMDNSQSDDWAISPELSGEAQTVTFKVRGAVAYVAPAYEVLYSTGSTNPDDFIPVPGMTGLKPLAAYWTDMKAHLPEGAKRIAFRCVMEKYNGMLNIDEVRFVSAKETEIVPEKYVVYRNDEQTSILAHPAASWIDDEKVVGEHKYHLTAMYSDNRESAPTSPVHLTVSGVGSVSADGITITTEHQEIIVKGCEGEMIYIFNTLGQSIYADHASQTTRIKVAPGIYVVEAAGCTAKLIVK